MATVPVGREQDGGCLSVREQRVLPLATATGSSSLPLYTLALAVGVVSFPSTVGGGEVDW